jgi:hypothetical protein
MSPILVLAVDGGEWSASRLLPFHPRYPLDRKFGVTQGRSGLCEEKNFTLPRIEPRPS